jgi:VCBS repeat-containing protein
MVLAGKYGVFSFNVADQTWAYQVDKDSPAVSAVDSNSEFHDLLTVTSLDGSAYQTLDVRVKGGAGISLPKIMNLLNVEGVTALGSSTTTDSVSLLGSGVMLDLTNTTTSVTHVERIDITGAGDNVVKLNLASIMQADPVAGKHRLFIDGNLGDAVQIAHSRVDLDAISVAGYNRYMYDDAELLINQAIKNTSFI